MATARAWGEISTRIRLTLAKLLSSKYFAREIPIAPDPQPKSRIEMGFGEVFFKCSMPSSTIFSVSILGIRVN